MKLTPIFAVVTLFMGVIFTFSLVLGQEATVIVPDVINLNLPQSVAVLNRAGLEFGEEVVAVQAVPADVVVGQSIPAGASVARGTRLNLIVARAPNALLIYDDNDLTLVNTSGGALDLAFLQFTTVEGRSSAEFQGARWGADRVPSGSCVQVWSVPRASFKPLTQCNAISSWLSSSLRGEYFWAQDHGVERFQVMYRGQPRAICPAAPPNSENFPTECALYLPPVVDRENANFIYLAYTENALAVVNTSTDRWMLPQGTHIRQMGMGETFPIADSALFSADQTGMGQVERLAPGQCVVYLSAHVSDDAPPPEVCEVIARVRLPDSSRFWSAPFDLISAQDGRPRACTASAPDTLTLCVLPR